MTRPETTLPSRLMMAMAELNLMRLEVGLGQNRLEDSRSSQTMENIITFLMATISKTMQAALTRSPTMMGSAFCGWTRLQSRQEMKTRLMKRYPWQIYW